jgi:phosphoribosylanthranilate isomerase
VSIFVKVCGITTREAASACVEAGTDAVGFVFADSPRRVSTHQARAISDVLPEDVLRVAVFRRPRPEEIEIVLEDFSPDLVQADHDSLSTVEVDRRLPVYREGDGAAPSRRRFLYEGPISGAGEQVDLQRAADVARLGDMILAGGLRPDTVGRAIALVRPYGVDVSSGVETEPGVKSPASIRSFVAAARTAGERLVST